MAEAILIWPAAGDTMHVFQGSRRVAMCGTSAALPLQLTAGLSPVDVLAVATAVIDHQARPTAKPRRHTEDGLTIGQADPPGDPIE